MTLPTYMLTQCYRCKKTIFIGRDSFGFGVFDDHIEIIKASKILGRTVIYKLHTECLDLMTQNYNYRPHRYHHSIIDCEVCRDHMSIAFRDRDFIEFQRQLKNDSVPHYSLFFHTDCFVSIAGNELPLEEAQ